MVQASLWLRSTKHHSFFNKKSSHSPPTLFSPSRMPNCPTCIYEFCLLDEGSSCGKCRAKKPGLSSIELRLINVSYSSPLYCRYEFTNIRLSALTLYNRIRRNVLYVVLYLPTFKSPFAMDAFNITVSEVLVNCIGRSLATPIPMS